MIEIDVPGIGRVELQHLFLDVNGTIAVDGNLVSGVAERLKDLSQKLEIHILTADTHGKQKGIDKQLGLVATRISPQHEAEQKANLVREFGASKSVAIGNGANDSLMLKAARLGIAIVGPEGAALSALQNADIVCTDICNALDLLQQPRRIIATLRR